MKQDMKQDFVNENGQIVTSIFLNGPVKNRIMHMKINSGKSIEIPESNNWQISTNNKTGDIITLPKELPAGTKFTFTPKTVANGEVRMEKGAYLSANDGDVELLLIGESVKMSGEELQFYKDYM